ncbi:glycosyltransferase [Xanthomonas translucens pv. translucens]|uniref:glycosyltransferase n=1 Tax=Xanthomonas campestris pv. translucens TaxID=343 RepID=UPI0021B7CE7A|nr:glycosyltransferase [Xanthomonas translucens]MCT8286348.1 glycosyltransferase [Xanthomonas translucens pv. translucens]MCT8304006.1 glycosyltransferase [Xanthomonas translucens pv. translucens]
MISFIVPAHDEAALIGDTLAWLHIAADALRLDYETLVVADACSDDTAQIARRHGAQVLDVQLRHIAAARNAGAAASRGRYLLFVDADTRVNTPLLAAALRALHTGAVGGGAQVQLLGDIAWHERMAQTVFAWLFRRTGIAPGCFLFCKRSAFDAAGGFDERYYAGEDVALSRALARRGRLVILREPVHTSDRKLRSFSKREHLGLLLQLLRRGRGMLRSRDALGFWYGQRRGR